MNYGLYLSASGVLTGMNRQDVIANNLANASTVGFKRDLAAYSQRSAESARPGADMQLADKLLDRLGGGTLVAPTQLDIRDGALRRTGNDLDIAIQGDGFLAVRATDDAGQAVTRLTRDGRLTLDTEGNLITTTGGHRVLDDANQPIQLNSALAATIDTTGAIRQNNQVVAQLRVVSTTGAEKTVQHVGYGLYTAADATLAAKTPASGRIVQGWLEEANVDPVREMVGMIEASRAINNNANMIRYHDTIMQQAATVLGRVS